MRWGRWPLRELPCDGLASVRAVYGDELVALGSPFILHSADRVRLSPGAALRQQFSREHRYAAAEIRFILSGTGLFHVRNGDGFLELLCAELPTLASRVSEKPERITAPCTSFPVHWARQPANWKSASLR